MAVSANCYFSNAIVGIPQVGANVNIYKEHTSPQFAIGTKFERQDGCVFRYTHFGSTVNSAGLGVSQDVSESSQTMTPAVFVASSSTYQMADEQPGVYPNMTGSRYMLITLASVQTDTFAGGYISISSGPSASSHTYRIRGNTATGNPDSGNFRVDLYDRLLAGLNSSQSFTIIGNRWANVETWGVGGTTDSLLAGVTMIPITTAGDYGWVQTRGICGVLADATTVLAGRPVSMSTSAGGAVMLGAPSITTTTSTAYAANLSQIVGIACVNSTASTFIPVVLMLE